MLKSLMEAHALGIVHRDIFLTSHAGERTSAVERVIAVSLLLELSRRISHDTLYVVVDCGCAPPNVLVHHMYTERGGRMAKRMTTGQARREWAKVLRTAERGTAVEVMRNGHPVAAVVSMAQYRKLEEANKDTLSDVIAQFRANVDPRDLAGPDPWAGIRDPSTGREIDLG